MQLNFIVFGEKYFPLVSVECGFGRSWCALRPLHATAISFSNLSTFISVTFNRVADLSMVRVTGLCVCMYVCMRGT